MCIRDRDEGETVCIYGDYDVDGVTSVALLRAILMAYDLDPQYFIPVSYTHLDVYKRQPFRRQGIQQPSQGLAGGSVQSCEGFVQQEDMGLLRQLSLIHI